MLQLGSVVKLINNSNEYRTKGYAKTISMLLINIFVVNDFWVAGCKGREFPAHCY